ncbi:MAG: 2-oxo acid dehydrogenase subunit E2 [Steroidobacteraceae bacterium]|nr:2-oxo acid dehydrogenase subunit E2 [Steroidobacteraceae bacterium]
MSRYVFKLPDLGEGTVSSEIVSWRVKAGDLVGEDQPLVEMSTDKAVIEVPSPVSGRVVSIAGVPGDQIAVGADLVVFETGEDAAAEAPPAVVAATLAPTPPAAAAVARVAPGRPAATMATGNGRVMASPATRRRAREAGIALAGMAGSGPGGRIERRDLDAALAAQGSTPAQQPVSVEAGPACRTGTEEVKVIGVRRVIANRMSEAKRNIPHFAYVEEVDVTELESLRAHLNSRAPKGTPPLTYLPFIVAALARVLEDFPQCNAHYDAERNVIIRHRAVHVGVATQTPDGLKVPVLRHAEGRRLRDIADEVRRISDAARNNTAKRDELTGSTITITSLGRLGGIVSTPVINAPEVAIIGINKAIDRPVVLHGAVVVRRMMNLSSSFDHRFVDGFDGAAMIQALKDLLEHPATIFMAE